MKQELIIAVVVHRGITEQLQLFDSLNKAKRWISSVAKNEGKTVREMQDSDYDISIWESKCKKNKWDTCYAWHTRYSGF